MPLFSCPANDPKVKEIELTDPCFISDLHLNAESPADQAPFIRFLQDTASHYGELVILGDFFDYWVGDDAAFTAQSVLKALKSFSREHPIYFMHGNRDFMVGARLMQAMGATLLDDPAVARLRSDRLLLSHGDLWCVKDIEYQKLRRKVRSVWWQWLMLRFPLKKRLEIAHNARMKSRASKGQKKADTMDVDNVTVAEAARRCKANIVIHGHTHRPGCIALPKGLTRYVLGDWRHNAERFEGSALVFKQGNPTVLHF